MTRPDTIAFMIRTPLTKRDYDRFGVEIFRSRGFKVRFLDLTLVLNPEYLLSYIPPDLFHSEDIIYFKSCDDLAAFLKHNSEVFVFDWVGCYYKTIFIYKYFRRFKIGYASFYLGNIPSMPSQVLIKAPILKRVTNKLLKIKNISQVAGKIRSHLSIFRNKWSVLICSLSPGISGLQPPKFVFLGGEKNIKKMPKPDKNTRIIQAHTLDYDLFLLNRDKLLRGNYCVFLDEYLPYHPDYAICGNPVGALDPDRYYNGLNQFFDWFEDKYKMPVIIASHPRANYDQKDTIFKGRKIIRARTSEIVAGANCVIAHGSTSINFAVLFKKPIIFLTSNDLEKSIYGMHITNYAAQFGARPINMDRIEEYQLGSKFNVDEGLYRQYLSDYIKVPGTPEKPFWEIVADTVLSEAG